jgi:DNA-binding response OmpR family regulator
MAGERVLVVEDDRSIGQGLVQALRDAEYDAVLTETGGAALAELDVVAPDLVLLDLGLPDVDGVDLCRQIRRRHPDMRIVMLTARTDEIEVVVGLDAGADDYLTKPFRLAELLARLRAHLRRPSPSAAEALETLVAGDLSVDVPARRVWLAGEQIELSPKEFDLLTFLLARAGQAVTREQIMSEVWDEHWFGSTKTLDMHMSTLRRKIGDDDQHVISTIRGVGYRLELA